MNVWFYDDLTMISDGADRDCGVLKTPRSRATAHLRARSAATPVPSASSVPRPALGDGRDGALRRWGEGRQRLQRHHGP